MPFDPNIPQPNDIRSSSQQDLLDNFSSLAAQWAINHVPLDTVGPTPGYHDELFFSGASVGAPNLAPPSASLFSFFANAIPQLFFQNGLLAANTVQLTTLPRQGVPDPLPVPPPRGGAYVTPWGLTINFGPITVRNITQTFTYFKVFSAPPYSLILSPDVTPGGPSPTWQVSAFSGTASFQASAISNRGPLAPNVPMFFLAIGPS